MLISARKRETMKSHVLSVVVSTAVTTLLVLSLPLHRFDEGRRPAARHDHDHREEFFNNLQQLNTTTAATVKMENLYDVQNSTLGFEEVKMISLPLRGDKQDAFAMQAALSGISFQQVDGVIGSTIPQKALPFRMDQDDMTVGCWRAHLNIWRDMISRNVQSMMIFEDDADWDVAFKSQLVQFALGSRWLTDVPKGTVPDSPYGDDWDILWFGHAAVSDTSPFIGTRQDNRRFVIPKDPTVLPPSERTEGQRPNMDWWENEPVNDKQTRIVLMSQWSINTAAYAVSQRGARKLLYHLSMLPFNEAVDQGMGWMCKYKIANIKCVAPFPALVGVSKPPGGTERWSDIGHVDDWQKGQEWDKGFSLRVMYSVRQNIDRLINGEKVFRSAVDTEMHINDISAAVGHTQLLDLWPKIEPDLEDASPPDRERMRVVDFTPKLQDGGEG